MLLTLKVHLIPGLLVMSPEEGGQGSVATGAARLGAGQGQQRGCCPPEGAGRAGRAGLGEAAALSPPGSHERGRAARSLVTETNFTRASSLEGIGERHRTHLTC